MVDCQAKVFIAVLDLEGLKFLQRARGGLQREKMKMGQGGQQASPPISLPTVSMRVGFDDAHPPLQSETENQKTPEELQREKNGAGGSTAAGTRRPPYHPSHHSCA